MTYDIERTHYVRRYPISKGLLGKPSRVAINRMMDFVAEWIIHNRKCGWVLHSVERTTDGCVVLMVGQRRV